MSDFRTNDEYAAFQAALWGSKETKPMWEITVGAALWLAAMDYARAHPEILAMDAPSASRPASEIATYLCANRLDWRPRTPFDAAPCPAPSRVDVVSTGPNLPAPTIPPCAGCGGPMVRVRNDPVPETLADESPTKQQIDLIMDSIRHGPTHTDSAEAPSQGQETPVRGQEASDAMLSSRTCAGCISWQAASARLTGERGICVKSLSDDDSVTSASVAIVTETLRDTDGLPILMRAPHNDMQRAVVSTLPAHGCTMWEPRGA